MISDREFELLVLLENLNKKRSQRELAKRINCSVGSINASLKNLVSLGYYDGNMVTKEGYKLLEPYRVKRAVFLAAGFGSRMLPITINTPKPLIRVNGIRIIDTLIDAAINAGIEEIVIVRGHLKEQFDVLLNKYPNIKFIDNLYYNDANNIYSLLMAKDLLEGSYIFDADIYLKNPSLIRKYEKDSFMYGVLTKRTDDWCLKTDKKGFVDSIEVGGLDAYMEVGISYWSINDGLKLKSDIEDVIAMPGGKSRFWELVPLKYKKENYKVSIRQCNLDDYISIDTFNELKEIDKAYC